jgi:hypothetical protein
MNIYNMDVSFIMRLDGEEIELSLDETREMISFLSALLGVGEYSPSFPYPTYSNSPIIEYLVENA